MPRIKDKPPTLNEDGFVDWLLEVYYYRFLDQGLAPEKTPLKSGSTPQGMPQEAFLATLRAQLTRFDLTFPLTKVPSLFARALREISLQP